MDDMKQVAIAYLILAALATAFLPLMAYWQYTKSEKVRFYKNAPIYGTGPQGTYAYIQCLDGSSIGSFNNFSEAEAYLQKYGK